MPCACTVHAHNVPCVRTVHAHNVPCVCVYASTSVTGVMFTLALKSKWSDLQLVLHARLSIYVCIRYSVYLYALFFDTSCFFEHFEQMYFLVFLVFLNV